MSQDGQGHGPDGQPTGDQGPQAWQPESAGTWSAPGQGTPAQPAYPDPNASAYPPNQPYGDPAPAPYETPGYQPAQSAPAYPSQFGPGGFQPAAGPPKTPAVAIVGLVLAFLMPLVGLVVSIVALGRTKRAGAGRGLAVAGTAIGAFLTVVTIAVAAFVIPRVLDLARPSMTVMSFSNAVDAGDCDGFMATSTQAFRADNELTTCEAFQAAVADSGVQDNEVSISSANVVNGVATVTTVETYTWADDGETYSDRYVYTVVKEDGTWRVDGLDVAGQ